VRFDLDCELSGSSSSYGRVASDQAAYGAGRIFACRCLGLLSADAAEQWRRVLVHGDALPSPCTRRECSLGRGIVGCFSGQRWTDPDRVEAVRPTTPPRARAPRHPARPLQRHDRLAVVAIITRTDATEVLFHHVGEPIGDVRPGCASMEAHSRIVDTLVPPTLADDQGTAYEPVDRRSPTPRPRT
jgi:hypothetical protein